ncbi:MAG TPA: fibronectin type III domain-containing protein [Gaiellaceae bacterium]
MRVLAVIAAAAIWAGTASAAVTAVTSASATLTWTTSSPVRERVAYGVGGLYLYTQRETTPSTSHSVTLTDLAPSTTYAYQVGSVGGSLTTAAAPASARFGTAGTRITQNGSLFFPVLSYEQCAATIARALAVGINTFVQVPYTGCTQPAGVTPPYVLGDTYDKQQGAGWYLPDEPDGWGLTPAQLPKLPAATDTGLLRVLNISEHFYSGLAPLNPQFDRDTYKQFTALVDVVAFDVYPIVKFCGRVPITAMFHAQRELMTIYAPGKPTFQWVETSGMTGECPTIAITPAIVNAETWLAVAGGACGIGYFTNSWTGPLWNRWDFDPGVEEALPGIVSRVQGLAPALCDGTYGDVVTPWDGTVVASSRELNGALYVIAVNGSPTATNVPFSVAGLAGRQLTVLGEGRTIKPVKKLIFRDSFVPYGVHIYAAAPTP